ncbi:MAG: hypothetical protein N3G76_01970 [Candidatus Micrarchaeota archaeon]|nr:hypothetical protein [Candidatus Micrarchaeota archaeon]
MQLQPDNKMLVYGAYAFTMFLLVIVAIQFALILDMSGKLDRLAKSTKEDIGELKTQVSGLGTIINTHLLDYEKLKSEQKRHGEQLDAHSTDIGNINNSVRSLEGNFSEFRARYIDLRDRYSNLLGYSESLKKGLDEFESSLMSKWQWIRDNAVLQPSELEKINKPLEAYCGTDIKIPCIAVVLRLKEGFGYLDDYGDQIKPINEFIADKGGDCEDWSLFMKSYINSQPDGKIVRAFATGGGDDYRIFEDGNDIYYYSNAHDVKIGKKGSLEAIVACYDMGDYGHCVLAFAKKEAVNSSLMERIDGAQAVEPQNGLLIGSVSREDNGSLYMNIAETSSKRPIYILITDSDLYLYDDGEWNSYGRQFEKLERLRAP